MSIKRKQFIQYYAKQAFFEETSLFLGAGVSASTGYPSWSKLLQPCAQQLGLTIDESTDLYLLAQYYSNKFGYSALKRIINDNINLLMHGSQLIEELIDLNFSSIWTTNYDTVLEKNLFRRNILSNSVFNDRDLANVSRSNRVNIYKLNGDITNLDGIVITQNDIDSYEPKHEMMLTFFKRELVASTFLFLGYSFTDKIVLSCLNSVNRCLQDSANYHFAVLKDNQTDEFEHFVEDLQNRYHVQVLLIKDYEELPQLLNELSMEISRKRVFFSGVFERLPYEEDIYAERLCKGISQSIIEKGYSIYTGYGRNFGNYLAGSAIQYLLYNNISIDRHLVMRPFLKTMQAEEKAIHREMLINACQVSVFMFGQSPERNGYVNSSGMVEEFEIAKRLNRIIIPVGSSGYTASELWKTVKATITEYPYLEKYIDLLNSPDPEVITAVISQIIDDVAG